MATFKFSVDGEYVTDMARRMFWDDRVTYDEAEKYLLGFLCGPPLDEQKRIAKQILEGRKKLVGINEFDLEEDDNIRIISPISIANRKNDAILAVKNDVYYHADKYIDFYAMDKSWLFFVGNTPEQAWQYAYTDMNDIARHVRHSNFHTIECIPRLYEPLDLSGCYDDSNEEILDHGAYLTQDYMLVYELLGEPLNGANRRLFYDRIYEYWENTEYKDNPIVRRRQERYKNAVNRNYFSFFDKLDDLTESREDAWNKVFNPLYDDEFTSKFGIIDTDGHWYNCGWGEHSLKSKTILCAKGIANEKDSLDTCLDKAVDSGYVLIRDVEYTGNPYVYGKPNGTQKQTIESYCNYWGIDNIDYY